jgi:hypothetical protein
MERQTSDLDWSYPKPSSLFHRSGSIGDIPTDCCNNCSPCRISPVIRSVCHGPRHGRSRRGKGVQPNQWMVGHYLSARPLNSHALAEGFAISQAQIRFGRFHRPIRHPRACMESENFLCSQTQVARHRIEQPRLTGAPLSSTESLRKRYPQRHRLSLRVGCRPRSLQRQEKLAPSQTN